MATSTGPDLSAAVQAVTDLMDDTCVVTLDAEGTDDADLDQETGELTEPDPDSKRIYSGRCMFSAYGSGYQQGRGGGAAVGQQYTLSLPVAAKELPIGAVVVCTSSRRDATLKSKRFQVLYPLHSTFTISRKAVVELMSDPA